MSKTKATDWIVEVVEDKYNQLGRGTKHSLNKLIKEYLSGLDKKEDSLAIDALTTWQKEGKFYYCMAYIANSWELTLEHEEKEK